MKVTKKMIGAAHDVCIKKGDFILSADLLERIYLAMDALANRHKTSGSPFCYHDGRNIVDPQHKDDADVFPLYREAAPRVPEGWQLVPKEPTEEMAREYWTFNDRFDVKMIDAWKAMLAAAPKPENE